MMVVRNCVSASCRLKSLICDQYFLKFKKYAFWCIVPCSAQSYHQFGVRHDISIEKQWAATCCCYSNCCNPINLVCLSLTPLTHFSMQSKGGSYVSQLRVEPSTFQLRDRHCYCSTGHFNSQPLVKFVIKLKLNIYTWMAYHDMIMNGLTLFYTLYRMREGQLCVTVWTLCVFGVVCFEKFFTAAKKKLITNSRN